MLYSQIALALEDISRLPRKGKADRIAAILTEVLQEPQMLCPAVRLLTGELWPRWDRREMGIGPESIAEALGEVCDIDLPAQREEKEEMGLVAEAALEHKEQNSLFSQPLDALSVYEGLRRVSTFRGRDSEQRKIAILRGLFLVATPLEGKFIARTALRSMQVGLGQQTMIAAISSALHCDALALSRAYSLLPDIGSIAEMGHRGELDRLFVQPGTPARFMIYPRGMDIFSGAYLPKYPGLRVQVHKKGDEVRIFSSQLREISSALNGLCRDLGQLEADFVADAYLIGFFNSASAGPSTSNRICSQREMLRYINRRRLARKSRIRPALLAYDLLVLEGEDICGMAYSERRAGMLGALGEPRSLPFSGISPAPERVLEETSDVEDTLRLAEKDGASELLVRDPSGIYRPGEVAEKDFLLRPMHTISALVVGMKWVAGRKGEPRPRFRVALREGEGLVPVGWVWRTTSECDCQPLIQAAKSLRRSEDEPDTKVAPDILLKIRIRGAHKKGEEMLITGPEIEGYRQHATPKDADPLVKLEKFCRE